jgi:predicted Ser/Thr protein kinase/tetratricopeptide (TPR) repeat protein
MRIGYNLADRFVLEQMAGRGGMGEVYRAIDRRTGKAVAVKVLRRHEDDQVTRFEREARILAGLAHPRIVRYVEHGILPSGEPYLAMEWLDGEDLATRLARGRLGTADGVALGVSVAEALAVLHGQGIVHRDLKPSNVFLVGGRIEQIKLLDFGLARIADSTRMTSSGAVLGTVAYMAPEQARGDQELDARADVFALGCVLFECLTGEPAFSAGHTMAILTKLLFEDTPRLADRLPGAPAALDALMARMLSKRVAERPRDGRALAEALRAFQETRVPDGGPAIATAPDAALEATIEVLVRRSEAPATVEQPLPAALTGSEQRAVAVLLVSAPAAGLARAPDDDAQLAIEAGAHGGRFERLLDGSAAVLLACTQVATDLAVQAARCALAMSRHTTRRLALAMGQGEITGRLPVGPVIDRATRLLQEHAPPAPGPQHAPIALDDAMVRLLDTRFEVRIEPGRCVLLGERDVAEVRTLLGKPTSCVGRERELRMLDQLFRESVAESVAQAVLVTAPPGVGKSRLAHEFLRQVRARGEAVTVWIGRGDSLRAGSALSLLKQALRGACEVRDGEPLEVRRSKVRAYVTERIAASERGHVIEFLGELIGVPFPDEHCPPLRAARADAQLMSELTRAAFLALAASECARQPLLILLEDLHWGDRPTVQFLDRALRDLEDRPFFVLALARPAVHELFPMLWAEHSSYEIRLQELSRKAIAQFARHVLGSDAGAQTVERLARLSEGNAFYLEELIRTAAEATERELPETLVAMVQSRIGSLDDALRRTLRAASVFGGVFWTGGVAALLGDWQESATRNQLTALVEGELLSRRIESRFPDQEEYAFRHALLREGTYAMLTDEDRALGHRLAGEWLEAQGEEDALVLAEHFENGGSSERASRHYLRAAHQALVAGDSTAAVAYAQRGLDGDVSGELRIALLGQLCESIAWNVERIEAARPQAEELVQMARRGSVPWAQGMFVLLIGRMLRGQLGEFTSTLRELLEAEPAPGAADIVTLAVSTGALLLDRLGRIEEADSVLERLDTMMGFAGQPPCPSLAVWHGVHGMRAAYARGEPEDGLRHSERISRCASVIGHPKYVEMGTILAAMNRWLLGAPVEAERALQGARVADLELGHLSSFRPFILAWSLAERGELGEARRWAEHLVTAGRLGSLPLGPGRGHWALAEVFRRAGDLDMAEKEIQVALTTLGLACPLDVPGALATLAALRLAQGRAAEALAVAEEGMAWFESMKGCSVFARGAFLRLIHAECLAAAGKHDAARAAIDQARQCILANAQKIQDPAHRQRFLDDVPENRETLARAREWLDER